MSFSNVLIGVLLSIIIISSVLIIPMKRSRRILRIWIASAAAVAFVFSFAIWHYEYSAINSVIAQAGMDQNEYYKSVSNAHLLAYRAAAVSCVGLGIYSIVLLLDSRESDKRNPVQD